MSRSLSNHHHTSGFRRGLSAAQVDRQLKQAVHRWQSAEQSVVLWFAELNQRRLYKQLGYGSIHLYAAEELDFSEARSYQLLKLAERLKALPKLEDAVATGEVGWTKARAVARVATPKTEGQWLDRAKNTSRRELEQQIGATRQRAKASRCTMKEQLDLTSSPAASASNTKESAGSRQLTSEHHAEKILECRTTLSIELDSEQIARYEALVTKLRQGGNRSQKAELLLSGLEALLQSGETGVDHTQYRGASASSYQVLIQQCPTCDSASVATSRGDREICRATLKAALCDARIKLKGERNRSVLAPRIRRQVLERDRHRCRMPGCSGRQFLNVHHIQAREDGGTHELQNLITLCGACHRALHEMSKQQQADALRRR